jgi:glycosyltransferase involved in cell wall biosynthesis
MGVDIPVVITMHGTDVNMWPLRFRWYRDALRAIRQNPLVTMTTHTETYREKLQKLGVPSERITVIPNSFDPGFASPSARSDFEFGSLFRVICVARMDIWKGHEHLIRGFERFHRTIYPSSTLTLVGYGPQEKELRALVDSLGLEEVVRFLGRVPHHSVPHLLRNHDVYVQPSITHPATMQEEGQPIAVLEAIASGIPVIVTNTGGVAETVRVGPYEGSAFVIKDKSADEIASALEQVVRARRDKVRAAHYVQRICEKHSQAGQLSATLAHYERVLSGSNSAATLDSPTTVAGEQHHGRGKHVTT